MLDLADRAPEGVERAVAEGFIRCLRSAVQPLGPAQLHALGGKGVVLAVLGRGDVDLVALKRQQVEVSGALAGVAQKGVPLAACGACGLVRLQYGGFLVRETSVPAHRSRRSA